VSRRLVVAVVALAAAACGAVGVVLLRDSDAPRAGGPLACFRCAGESVSLTVDPGKPFTHGLVLLRNRSDQDARLLSIDVVGRPKGLRIVGARLVDPARSPWGLTALDRSFPPVGLESKTTKLEDGVVPVPRRQGEAREVLLGLVADSPGVFEFRGIVLEYAVDDVRYRARFEQLMRVCVPRNVYRGRCEPPAFEG
jgi:hypothetical protein